LWRGSSKIDAQGIATSEAETLVAIRSWTGLIVVDFDETLLLRNSTEEFIDCAVPSVLAAILLRLLDLCAPWRWRGGARSRDVWRVRMVCRLLPWTMRLWRAKCPRLASEHANAPLLSTLRQRGEPFVVASIGFSPLIRPLLDSMGCPETQLIACRVDRRDRQRGKLALITAAIGADALADAMVVTDSADDSDVLAACARPCLTRWHDATFRRALRQVYLPGDYLVHVKRPLQEGAFRRLVTDDLALWLLITAPGLQLVFLAGVTALFFSLWSVYEIGYWENDACAVRLEADPVVSAQFADFDTAWFEPKAWAAAILLGLLGILAVRPSNSFEASAAWAAVLAALRAVYWLYNRIDKRSRAWVYIALHMFRTLAVAAIMPVGVIGMMAGVTQTLARWQEYFWYRLARAPGGFRWTDTPVRLIQLVFLILVLGALACAGTEIWTWRAAALLAWSLFLARKDIRAAIQNAHRLDRANLTR